MRILNRKKERPTYTSGVLYGSPTSYTARNLLAVTPDAKKSFNIASHCSFVRLTALNVLGLNILKMKSLRQYQIKL